MGKAILKNGLKGIADFDKFALLWDAEYKKLIEENPIPLKNGIEELLNHIKSSKTPMAVATSTATDQAKGKLKDSGILEYFDSILGGDQVVESKPNPEIYLKAASKLSSEPDRCLALEDSMNGVKAAVAENRHS